MHIWWMTTFKDQIISPIRNAFKISVKIVKKVFSICTILQVRSEAAQCHLIPLPVQMYTCPRHSAPTLATERECLTGPDKWQFDNLKLTFITMYVQLYNVRFSFYDKYTQRSSFSE